MNPHGALLLGAFFASLLTGITTVQTLLYFKLFPDDDKPKKILVIVVWILDLLHLALIWNGMWFYLIDSFGDASKLQVIPTSIAITGILTATITMLAHFFYVSRIFRFSQRRRYWLASPILVLAICRVAVASATSGQMFRLKNFLVFTSQYKWLLSLGLALSCAVDVLITTSMFTLLWQSRKHSSRTSLVDALLLYSLEIGSLTGCATVVAIVIWLVLENKVVFLALHFSIAKLYANSLLATLNARYQLRRRNVIQSSQSWQNWRLGTRFPANERETTFTLPPIQIEVEKSSQFIDSDPMDTPVDFPKSIS